MSGQDLWLDPQSAGHSGRDLASSGQAIVAERQTLGAAIRNASSSPPWGNDDIGAAFEKNYRTFETSIMEAWLNVGRYVESLGDGVVQAVAESVTTDSANAQKIMKSKP
jgi:hypothetical protein